MQAKCRVSQRYSPLSSHFELRTFRSKYLIKTKFVPQKIFTWTDLFFYPTKKGFLLLEWNHPTPSLGYVRGIKRVTKQSRFWATSEATESEGFPLKQSLTLYMSVLQGIFDLWKRFDWKYERNLLLFSTSGYRLWLTSRELKQPRRQRQQELHKFAYLTTKNNTFARFARAFFLFSHFDDVLVVSTTWNDLFCGCADDLSIFNN